MPHAPPSVEALCARHRREVSKLLADTRVLQRRDVLKLLAAFLVDRHADQLDAVLHRLARGGATRLPRLLLGHTCGLGHVPGGGVHAHVADAWPRPELKATCRW
jgi:hypothetical protein